MFDVASKKLGLDRVVLGKQQDDESIDKALKTEEVERILKVRSRHVTYHGMTSSL